MQLERPSLVVVLLLNLTGAEAQAQAQEYDTSWIDPEVIAAGEVALRTDKPERLTTTIDVAIRIESSREAIWDILTACEIAPEFVPNVLECELIDSINDGRSELFIQTVKPAFFIPKFEHVFRLDYFPPGRIEVHRVSGPIAEMEGAWRLLLQDDESVLLVHSLRVQPGLPVPHFFVRATLRRDLPTVLQQVRQRAENMSHE